MMREQNRNLTDQRIKRKMYCLLFTMLIIFVIALIYDTVNKPNFKVHDNVIKRNLSWVNFLEMDYEPINRDAAWDSELPNFMYEDIQYAEENDIEKIEYVFKSSKINLLRFSEDWDLYFNDDFSEHFYNFSLYRNKTSISVYGYYHGSFCKTEIGYGVGGKDILTYYPDLPFNLELDETFNKTKVGDYTLLNSYNSFYLYKDGNIITSTEFEEGNIKKIQLFRGIFTTTNNELYIILLGELDGKPQIIFQLLSSEIEVEDFLLSSPLPVLYNQDKTNELPIIKKKDGYYVICPEDWNTFEKYNVQTFSKFHEIEENKIKISLVSLLETFEKAEISYSAQTWTALLIFNLNGEKYLYEYYFGGYDESINLPDSIAEKFSLTVESFGDLWKVIENVRESYYEFYDHQGTYMSPGILYICKLLIL